MSEPKFSVLPFGDRWTITRGVQRLSIHASFDQAMTAVMELARQATAVGEQAAILVRERQGSWREVVYSHQPEYFFRSRSR